MTNRPPPKQIGRPLGELTDADKRELLGPIEAPAQIAPLEPETVQKAIDAQRRVIQRAWKRATKHRDNSAAQGLLQLAVRYVREGRKMPRELAQPIAAGLQHWTRLKNAARELVALGAIVDRRAAAVAAHQLERVASFLERSNSDRRNYKLLAQATRAAKPFFGQGAGRRAPIDPWALAASVHFGVPRPAPELLGVLSGSSIHPAIRDAAEHHGVHPDTAESAYRRFRFRLYGIARPTVLPKWPAKRRAKRQQPAVPGVTCSQQPSTWVAPVGGDWAPAADRMQKRRSYRRRRRTAKT